MSLEVFQTKLTGTTIQLVADNLNVFNQASNGAIVLGTGEVIKDTIEKITVGIIDGLVSDRNAYAPVGTPALAKVLARIKTSSVNLSAKVGPVALTTGIMNKIMTDVNQAAGEVATQATQAILQYYISAACGAGAAAINSQSGAIYTQPAHNIQPYGGFFPTSQDFPLAASLFGDANQMITTWFMDGVTWSQFIAQQAVPSAQNVFAIGNMKVFNDGLGRQFIVSDPAAAAAKTGAAATNPVILGLVPGAVAITTNGLTLAADQKLGGENIERWWQGEFDINVAVKGYKVKKAFTDTIEGLKSAVLSDVQKSSNWELDVGSVDNSPATLDGVNGEGTPTKTGTLKRQAAQAVPTRKLKETAGVIIKLTATAAP